MISRPAILGILFILEKIQARGENKKDWLNITSSRDHLKTKFGCVPLQKWNLMELSENDVEVACMSNDYHASHEPTEIFQHPIFFEIYDSTIVDIDEKKKTITTDLQLMSIWRDERIKVVFSNDKGWISLPPVKRGEKSTIWEPFSQLYVWSLQERRYIFDPTILNIGIISNERENRMMIPASGMDLSLANNSAVSSLLAYIGWKVTVSCPFIFSAFPFDNQKCNLTMELDSNANFTVHSEKHNKEYDADGFKIKSYGFGPLWYYYEAFASSVPMFGVEVQLKRPISKYVLQYYLPAITIVMASSVSFIIPLSAIPGRVALVVTLFLTLTNIFIHEMVRASNVSTKITLSLLYYYCRHYITDALKVPHDLNFLPD